MHTIQSQGGFTMDLFKNGLNGFQLKLLALIFMTFDHIAYMFSGIIHVPIWFHIIGRISAPLSSLW